MSSTLETELKLRASEAALIALARAPSLGPATLGPARTVEEVDVYLDTADGRLAAAGWACRLRTRGGRRRISLKGPPEHPAGTSLHLRPEIEADAPDDRVERPVEWPSTPARSLVLSLAGERPLAERLTLHQSRTERSVLVKGRTVATLSLDRVAVVEHGEPLGHLRVVELELVPGAPTEVVDTLVADLGAMPGLRSEPASKLERAVMLAEGAAGAPR